jgi:hypothetical protein
MRNTVLVTLLVGFTALLLANASLIPDPCFADSDACCPQGQSPDPCGLVCCTGIQATPEGPFVLEKAASHEPCTWAKVPKPKDVALEPLFRPPISA